MKAEWGIPIPGGYFSEADHRYRNKDGVVVPSTTQVFSILGLNDFDGIPQEVLEWKRQYGAALHSAVEYLAAGDLDWDSVDENIIAPLTGVEEKLGRMQYAPEAAEERKVHSVAGMEYGMTCDLRGKIVHQGKERSAIIDLKTAAKVDPTWAWQVGAYVLAQERVPLGWMGIVLQVCKDGKVVPHYIDVLAAQREFQVLLAAAHLMLNNGFGRNRF